MNLAWTVALWFCEKPVTHCDSRWCGFLEKTEWWSYLNKELGMLKTGFLMLANKDFLWVWFIHFIFQCINFILFLCSMFVIIRYKLHHRSFQKNNIYIYILFFFNSWRKLLLIIFFNMVGFFLFVCFGTENLKQAKVKKKGETMINRLKYCLYFL